MALTINLGFGFWLGAAVLVALLSHWLRGMARTLLTQERLDAAATAAEKVAVRASARFMVTLLAQPDVHAAVTNIIAQGINAWSESRWPGSRVGGCVDGWCDQTGPRSQATSVWHLRSCF
jgi:hypothetical protein